MSGSDDGSEHSGQPEWPTNANDLREKTARDAIIKHAAKKHDWQTKLGPTASPSLVSTVMDIVDALLLEMGPIYWHDDDVCAAIHKERQATLEQDSPTGSPPGKRPRGSDTTKPKDPYTIVEQAVKMREPQFGFLTQAWLRVFWSESATAAASRTYKTEVLDKLTAAELITTEIMVKTILTAMDTWLGKVPIQQDVDLIAPIIQRLFSRARGLAAPKGTSGAISTAIDRTFRDETEGLDPKFKSAADAAYQVELFALGGGYGAMAGSKVPGALQLFRSYEAHGGGRGGPTGGRHNRGGKGGGRGTPQGGRGRDKGDVDTTNKEIECWNCGLKGHPRRLCPKKGKGVEKDE